jgi:hypothetical protein
VSGGGARSRRLSSALLALVAALVALLLGCGLAGAAARAGTIALPAVDMDVGPARLIGRTSEIPYCSQLIGPDCIGDDPAPRLRLYTVWLFIRTERGSWQNPEIHQLLSLTLGEH